MALDPYVPPNFLGTLIQIFQSSTFLISNGLLENFATSNSRGAYHYQIHRVTLRLPLSVPTGREAVHESQPYPNKLNNAIDYVTPGDGYQRFSIHSSTARDLVASDHHRFELKPTPKRRSPALDISIQKLYGMTSSLSQVPFARYAEAHPDNIRTDETPPPDRTQNVPNTFR